MRISLPFFLTSLLLVAACGADEKAADPVATPTPVAPKGPSFDYAARASELNVIVVSMDALRFDHTGLGGGTFTPNLDAFQKEAVAFSKATAAAPWTVPSHMAIFTGRWPSHHGVVNKLAPDPAGGKEMVIDRLKDSIPTFPEELTKKGWEAVAFTGGAGISGKFGFDRGFTSYLDDKVFAGMDYSGPPAMAWLSANADHHFLMFFHGYDVHGQHPMTKTVADLAPEYTGPIDGSIEQQGKLREAGLAVIVNPGDAAKGDISPEDTAILLKVYQQKVREADERLGLFLTRVRELGLMDKSIVVVLADHGDEFMEHGYLDHGATICEHQVHVPMMVRFPGGEGARVVETPVRTIDMFPTVFDALGVDSPAEVDGKSLIPLLRGEAVDLPIYTETDYRLFVHHRARTQDGKKLILDLGDGQKALYDLNADPQEAQDLSESDPRTAYEMEQDVRTWMSGMKSDPNKYLGVQEEYIVIF
jgi:arylsulfatase A-like enzyme